MPEAPIVRLRRSDSERLKNTMRSALVFACLLVSTIHVVHADTHCNSAAAKKETCQGQASGETTNDHERAPLNRKKSLLQKSISAEKNNLLEEASQRLVSSRSGFITDMKVINGKNEGCGEGWEKVSGETLNGDLNEGCGKKTDYIWLCVKKGSDNWKFTDLKVVASNDYMTDCGKDGWQQISSSKSSNGDLNQGAGGKFIFLCYIREADKDPLSELRLTERRDCEEGMFKVGIRKSNGDLNQNGKRGCKEIFLCAKRALPQCKGSEVQGQWVYKSRIAVEMTMTIKWGSAKTLEEVKTSTWAESVSASVSAGHAAVGSLQVTGTLAEEMAHSQKQSWSSNTEETIERKFGADDVNKALWQFEFHITDTCGNEVDSKTQEIALTEARDHPPCCIPGYNIDPAYRACRNNDTRIYSNMNCS